MPRWSAYQRASAAWSRARKNRPPMPVTRSIVPPVWVAGRGEDAPGSLTVILSVIPPRSTRRTGQYQADVTVDLSCEDDTPQGAADGWEATHDRSVAGRAPPGPTMGLVREMAERCQHIRRTGRAARSPWGAGSPRSWSIV